MLPKNYPLGNRSRSPDIARQLKIWVAQHFDVGEDGFVSVMELKCSVPDCPPAETVLLAFRGDGATFEGRVHAALQDVRETDIIVAFREPRRVDGPKG